MDEVLFIRDPGVDALGFCPQAFVQAEPEFFYCPPCFVPINERNIRVLTKGTNEFVLGRLPTADIKTILSAQKQDVDKANKGISRHHASIDLKAGTPFICHMPEARGETSLNGVSINTPSRLMKGQVISIPHRNEKNKQVCLKIINVACHGIHLRNESDQPPSEYVLLRWNTPPTEGASSLLARLSHQQGLRLRHVKTGGDEALHDGDHDLEGIRWAFKGD